MGDVAPIGATRISQNGYSYTKVRMDGPQQWRLTHHVRYEQKIGRPIDTSTERICFIDGDRTNLSYNNLKSVTRGEGSLKKREAELEDRIRELQAQLEYVREKLASQSLVKT
jgi:hypothetical protein